MKTNSPPHVHWYGPTCMLGALLAGILLALGHHIYYASLDENEVPAGDHNLRLFSVSRQQVTAAVGTAFAFAVRSALVLAISSAYVQLFWLRLVAKSKKLLALQDINAAFSAPRNVFILRKGSLWLRFPLLCVIALVTWLMPLASITTPGSLSIINRQKLPSPSNMTDVPAVRFDTMSYLAGMTTNPGPVTEIEVEWLMGNYSYNGPSQALRRLATAIGAQGAILPIVPPSPNASWTSTFDAPALQCLELPQNEQSDVQNNIAEHIKKDCKDSHAYLVWYDALPYSSTGSTGLNSSDGLVTAGFDLDEMPKRQRADFRIAVIPQLLVVNDDATGTDQPWACNQLDIGGDPRTFVEKMSPNSTVLQCSLAESSYKVDFNFTNGEQIVSTARDVFDPGQSIEFLNMVYGPSETCNNLTLTLEPPVNGKRTCKFDGSLLRRLSYQAMLDAFLGVVGGNIGVSAEKMIADSNIINTVLVNSYELNFLTDYEWEQQKGGKETLQVHLRNTKNADIAGLFEPSALGPRRSLSQNLERLFENFTISLMNSPEFRYLPETLPKTNVSFATYHNVYVYAEGRLWLAYGAAIFFAASAVGVGLHAVFANGVSYSNDFTTILRVTRHAIMDVDVSPRDNGSDPLPCELANIKFSTSTFVGKQGTDAEEPSSDDASVVNEPKQGLVSELLLPEEDQLRVGFGGRSRTW